MGDNSKDLTEDEQQEAGRAMLAAALDALGDFPGDVDQEDQDETARRVIRALVAASIARLLSAPLYPTLAKLQLRRLESVSALVPAASARPPPTTGTS